MVARARGTPFLTAWAVLAIAMTVPLKMCHGQHILVDSTLAVQLDRLAQDSVEHVVCLYGSTRPDSVFLFEAHVPQQRPVGTHNVASDWQPCLAALAHWHNHPVPRDSVARARDYLFYSLTDEHSFMRFSQALVALVAVPGEWCMWVRLQVKEGLDRNLTPLPRVEAQCVTL